METIEPLEMLYETIQFLVAKYGPFGIAVAMFAESAGIPFASAVVIITSGSMILRGGVSFWSVFIASVAGITTGSIFSYLIGLIGSMVGKAVKTNFFYNRNNHKGGLMPAEPPRSKMMQLWNRYGNFSIFMAQLWGFTRTFISYPAGAMHMNFYLFTLYTFLGGAIFSLVAITLSIVLTSTMGLTLRMLRLLGEYSPWLLLAVVLMAGIILFLYIRKTKIARNKRNDSDRV